MIDTTLEIKLTDIENNLNKILDLDSKSMAKVGIELPAIEALAAVMELRCELEWTPTVNRNLPKDLSLGKC